MAGLPSAFQSMSILGTIATAALKPAAAMLGPNGAPSELAIDSGPIWQGTVDEERTAREYLEGGQEVEISQRITGATAEFVALYPGDPQSYLGKVATLDGKSRRIAEIEKGEAFTTITVSGSEEAP